MDRPTRVIYENKNVSFCVTDRQNASSAMPGMVKTHSFARRRRSEAGASRDPTPTAAVPFNGKKPCRPIIAAWMIVESHFRIINETRQLVFYKKRRTREARTGSDSPRRLPEFLMIYSARLDHRITRCEEGTRTVGEADADLRTRSKEGAKSSANVHKVRREDKNTPSCLRRSGRSG